MKTKTNTKIILTIILVIIAVFLYDKHKDQTRAEYAQNNDCTWAISGAHDVCR